MLRTAFVLSIFAGLFAWVFQFIAPDVLADRIARLTELFHLIASYL